MYFIDTALLCHLLGIELLSTQNNGTWKGRVIENFVATELIKQLSWQQDGQLYHYRTHDDQEIDFVIEKRNRQLVGIEVKASATVNADDFKAMRNLQALIKKDFIKGVILYQGKQIIPFGENLYALPISALF